MSGTDGQDRFSLLFLEDGEYYFRDFHCHHCKDGSARVAGDLKVCSASLYFVPRAALETIFRVPFQAIRALSRVTQDANLSGEDMFEVGVTEYVDVKINNRTAPYVRRRGSFTFRFSLMYTSLDDVLPQVQELLTTHQGRTKEHRVRAEHRLAEIIKLHEENERFNPGWLEDENEKIVLELVGSCITPLCSQPGRVVITYCSVYFQPFNVVSNNPIQTYHLSKVLNVSKRTHLLEDAGLEVFFPGRNSLFLTFKSPGDRDLFVRVLRQQPELKVRHARSLSKWLKQWRQGKVSNFEYLMYLNREAGRSFKDLTQYPIFPWIIADWDSEELDLSSPATFRDLSKPIGALSLKRLTEFRTRFQELKRMCEASHVKLPGSPPPLVAPPFLYGCHYSTPGYVVYYLMRSDPQLMLRLQNGRFDAPDRCFWSIMDTWRSVTSLPTDVKELIPEFYSTDSSFLVNMEGIDFGERSSGVQVGDVDLPRWASDAADFVQKLADALESPHVSANLHLWIDLIFGHKNQGRAAVKADNVFHYLTYDDVALKQLEREEDGVMREALRVQMMEFGRTPRQLFRRPHPKRNVTASGDAQTKCWGMRKTRRPSSPRRHPNILRPAFHGGKNVSGISRAVSRLASRKVGIRDATLAWLQQTARSREPEHLVLKRATDLGPLVKAARDHEMLGVEAVLVQAVDALAGAPGNVGVILDAGALEPLLEALTGRDHASAAAAAHALGLLAREEDARLGSLPHAPLQVLLEMICLGRSGHDVHATAAMALANLARYPANRATIVRLGGMEVLLNVVRQRTDCSPSPSASPLRSGSGSGSSRSRPVGNSPPMSPTSPTTPRTPRVRRHAAAALAALLEDDENKLQLVESVGVEPLMEACEGEGPELQAVSMQCIAALTMHDALKAPVLDAEGLAVIGAAARSPSAGVQRPAAAALANLCGDASLLPRVAASPDGIPSLLTLSQSADRIAQRNTARAWWHLAAAEGQRARLLEGKGLRALLHLAAPDTNRSPEARTLARQALKRLADDPQVQALLEVEACHSDEAATIIAQLSGASSLAAGAGERQGDNEAGSGSFSPVALSQTASADSLDNPQLRASRSPSNLRWMHRRVHSAADSGGHAQTEGSADGSLGAARPTQRPIWQMFTRSGTVHEPIEDRSLNGSPDEARTSVELSVRASSLRNAGSASHQRPSSDKAHADRAELDDSPMHMSADDSPFRSAASRSEAASPIAVSAAADVIERSSSAASSPDRRTIDRDKGRSRQRSSVSPAVTPPDEALGHNSGAARQAGGQ